MSININVLNTFKKDNPNLKIKDACVYNSKYILICAQETNEIDCNAPFYAISIKDGSWYSFNPLEDLEGFSNAFRNNKILIK